MSPKHTLVKFIIGVGICQNLDSNSSTICQRPFATKEGIDVKSFSAAVVDCKSLIDILKFNK